MRGGVGFQRRREKMVLCFHQRPPPSFRSCRFEKTPSLSRAQAAREHLVQLLGSRRAADAALASPFSTASTLLWTRSDLSLCNVWVQRLVSGCEFRILRGVLEKHSSIVAESREERNTGNSLSLSLSLSLATFDTFESRTNEAQLESRTQVGARRGRVRARQRHRATLRPPRHLGSAQLDFSYKAISRVHV